MVGSGSRTATFMSHEGALPRAHGGRAMTRLLLCILILGGTVAFLSCGSSLDGGGSPGTDGTGPTGGSGGTPCGTGCDGTGPAGGRGGAAGITADGAGPTGGRGGTGFGDGTGPVGGRG